MLDVVQSKNFLVTGGAGFIGSHIVEYLVKNNAKFVRIVDNLSTGTLNNIQALLDSYNNVEFVYGDITDIYVCLKVLKDIDIVCHQAAIGSIPRSINNPLNTHNSNINGFMNIISVAKDYGIKRIVYASSSSVYGDNDILPKREDIIGKQISPYAVTKYVNELYGNIFTKLYNMELIGLRYFNVYGPRQTINGPYAAVIPKFMHNLIHNQTSYIYGDGTNSRDFTFVSNVVQANILAMLTNNSDTYGQIFNIGCGNNTSIIDLYNKIKIILNKNIDAIFLEKRNGDISHSLADISKAKQLLNYSPNISLDEGLEITIKYLKDLYKI